MPFYQYKEHAPSCDEGVFVSDSTDVIGQVEIGAHANLWFGVVARGDVNKITIGENTNVQDLTMLHVTEELALNIGRNVSIGHNVVLHACTVEDSCLIGMGAIILDGAHIGKNSVVAAGSVVPPGKKFPGGSMIMGSPAKVVRELSEEEKQQYGKHYQSYVNYKKDFLDPRVVKRLPNLC